MTILRDISFLWSMIHVIVLFLLLFEPKYPARITLLASAAGVGAVVAVNVFFMALWGPAVIMRIALFSCTLPSLLLFYLLSKYRDGRFFFTYCLSDTCCFWILQLTNLLDRLCGGGYVVLLVSRIAAFLALEVLLWLRLRRPYLELQKELTKGWWLFVSVGVIYYLLIFTMCIPVGTALPAPLEIFKLMLVMVLMPITYLTILGSLRRQMQVFESRRQQQALRLQTGMMAHHVELMQQSQEALRIQRHDLRHRLQAVAALVEQGDRAEALACIDASQAHLNESRLERWCENPVLNAILASYFEQARRSGIRVEARLALPGELPVDALELATVFANALENAIHACAALPAGERRIVCVGIDRPRLMFQVANPYAGEVRFDPSGLPLAQAEGHGFGTRSIAAFCEKHGGLCSYEAKEGWFKMQVSL